MKIKPGSEEECCRRHQQVWPELLADLKQAGCSRYSIYMQGLDLLCSPKYFISIEQRED
jgi:L-rhamnose mutarotase